MKRVLIFCLFCLLFVFQTTAQRTYVLVTGVSNYQNENINLSQTTKDATAVQKVWLGQTPHVTLLTSRYANHDNILEKLRALCNRATPQDRIVFYFSGHGGNGCICAFDKNISYDELMAVLKGSQAKEKYCFIDACHAGSVVDAIKGENQNSSSWMKGIDGSDLIFYMSCRSNEYSYEHSWVGKGFFTQALLKGIRGKADVDRNRQITVKELFDFIYSDVTRRSNSEQHPQLIASPKVYKTVVARWD